MENLDQLESDLLGGGTPAAGASPVQMPNVDALEADLLGAANTQEALMGLDPSLDTRLDKLGKTDRGIQTLEDAFQKAPMFFGVSPEDVKNLATGAGRQASKLMKLPQTFEKLASRMVSGGMMDSLPGVQMPPLLTALGEIGEKIDNSLPEEKTGLDRQGIMQAAGNMAVFAGGGMLSGPEAVAAGLTSAGLGAAAGAQAGFEEADEAGADPTQQLLATAGNAVFGASEGFPGGYFMGKLNKATGGALFNKIKDFGLSGETGAIREAIKSAIVEGSQEGFQTVGENWVAKDLANYDPNRTLGENFWQSVATGGLLGSSVGGAIGAIHSAERTDVLRRLDEIFKEFKASGDPINDLEGATTPVGDLMALQTMRADVDTKLAAAKAAAPDEVGRIPIIDEAEQRLNLTGGPPELIGYWRKLKDLATEPRVETGLRTEDGGQMSVYDGLQRQDVVVTELGLPYVEMLGHVQTELKAMDERIKNGEHVSEQDYDLLQESARQMQVNIKIAEGLGRHIKDYAAAFKKILGENTKIVVSDFLDQDSRAKGVRGEMNIAHDVQFDGDPKKYKVAFLMLNFEEIIKQARERSNGVYQHSPRDKQVLFEVATHELGHALVMTELRELRNKAITGDQDAYETLNMLTQEYRTWLKWMAKGNMQGKVDNSLHTTQADFIESRWAPTRGVEQAEMWSHGMGGLDYLRKEDARLLPGKNYFLSFDEWFAEQTARLGAQGKLQNPVMTRFFKPVLKQYQEMFQALPQFGENKWAGNWENYLLSRTYTHRIKEAIELAAAGGGKDLSDALRGKLPGFDPKNFAGKREHLDKWSKLMQYGYNLLQLAKENPHIVHFQNYIRAVTDWQNYQRALAVETNDTIIKWRSLGKVESSTLTDVLFEEAENKMPLSPAELSKRLTVEQLSVYKDVREGLAKILEEMRQVALEDANRTFNGDSEAHQSEVKEINEEFDKLKDSGYFPYLRFGKYTLTVTAKEDLVFDGEKFKKHQLISFPVFESEAERNAAMAEIKKELGAKAAVSPSVMKETEFQIHGMPRALLRALKSKLEAAGQFNDETRKAFENAMQATAPFKSFKKHFLKRKGIHGFSQDGLRAFAYYMRSGSGHIAKVKYADAMREPIAGMQEDVEIIKFIGGNAQNRQKMQAWMTRHFDYLMDPATELAALRALGFVAYLGFNVKSAMVNLTQLMTTVGPYLASRYGDVNTFKAMNKGVWILKDYLSNRQDYIDALPDANGVVVKANEERARHARLFSQGLHEGWIDQSLATELAIAASENNLNRSLYLPSTKSAWHKISRWSAAPFHLVEKLNRYVTAISAYELEYSKSKDHGKAVAVARDANRTANYENSRWNRAEFMRGKKSVFFLFANYMQNTLYFVTKDKGSSRFLLSMLLLAGLMGLPGAEDLEDLVDYTVTKLNKILGLNSPKFDLRLELRQALEELDMDPDLVLHGLGHTSFGLANLGEMTGIPVPSFDLSGSLGVGNIVPLTEIPGMLETQKPADVAMSAAVSATGASGNLVEDLYRNLFSGTPDGWKQAEKIMPLVSVRNLSKATRYATRGGEYTASNEPVAEFDPYSPREMLELAGLALGFQPTQLSSGWERLILQREQVAYYKQWQTALLAQHNWAVFQEDRESSADVRKEILDYNKRVPFPEMGITGKTLKASTRAYVEGRLKNAEGVGGQKKYRRLLEKVGETYPDPLADDGATQPIP